MVSLAKAAKLPTTAPERTILLAEAGVLLWRFDNRTFPLTHSEISAHLSKDIEDWLPHTVRFKFTGKLIISGISTQLADNILVDLSGNAFIARDSIIKNLESDPDGRHQSFREILTKYGIRAVINQDNDLPEYIVDALYEKVPQPKESKYFYTCHNCGFTLDHYDYIMACSSPYCSASDFYLEPPHRARQTDRIYQQPYRYEYKDQLRVTPLTWRTLCCPLMMERKIFNDLRKIIPKDSWPALKHHESSPGVLLSLHEKPILFDPIIINHPRSILEYYMSNPSESSTWIVVPRGYSRFFKPAKMKLPNTYNITTTHSFKKEYLYKYHGIGIRVEPWKMAKAI
ncbi:hypothetical protein [Pseudomonas putida]|uniref:hypothetical protein n=1 Tax=Pseudomonas putida TaxID=303 RepID=UPI00275D61D4|nr:hypothetical protein [Pseudomonas putida]MDP9523604.1 hypothetical protein [Pseudomonas putida]